MQITRQADYAIRAILYLARTDRSQLAATNLIAKAQHIPPSFLAKIVSQLSIAGLLHTSRGARGGVTLARDPKDITLLDVIEAIDGPILLNQCAGQGGACPIEGECPLRNVWCDAQDELENRLRRANFAQMISREQIAV